MVSPEELHHELRHLLSEVRHLRHSMANMERFVREATIVRTELLRDIPTYWDDRIRLHKVKKRLGDAR